jgi:hypothetical protein
MNRITNLKVINRFTSNDDGKTYGEYSCDFNGEKKLFIQNGDSWGVVSHWWGKPVTECVNIIRSDVRDELILLLGK